jgi:hypothetical protein
MFMATTLPCAFCAGLPGWAERPSIWKKFPSGFSWLASFAGSAFQALLNRAQVAVDAAAEIVVHSPVVTALSRDVGETGLTRRCAWCGRYCVDHQWVVVAEKELLRHHRWSAHTICEDCVSVLREARLSA